MRVLKRKTDKIEIGIYAGETLYSCISKYGRESILELLKYYDVDDAVLKANRYHRVPSEEEIINQGDYEIETWMSADMSAESSNTSVSTLTQPISVNDSQDALDTSDIVELDDNRRMLAKEDYKNSVLYDDEDDETDSKYRPFGPIDMCEMEIAV